MTMKKETLAEYLARGGKITKCPPYDPRPKQDSVRSTVPAGPANIMTLDEADLFFGEKKARKVKAKSKPTIDLAALPPELRKKYVDDVIDKANNEED
jgi:hypothetical protein